MMRILFVLHQFYPEFAGGTERVTLNLAKAVQRAGHYVHVLACTVYPETQVGRASNNLRGAYEYVHDGLPVTVLQRAQLVSSADFDFAVDEILTKKIQNWLATMAFEVAHITHFMRMASAMSAIQKAEIPYVVTLTDFFPACYRVTLVNVAGALCPGPDEGKRCADECLVPALPRQNLRIRYRHGHSLLEGASARICPSEFVARRYREIFPELEFRKIPHGIDLLTMLADPPKQKKAGMGLTLGYGGTINFSKGLDFLLRAIKQVEAPDLRLRVMGPKHGIDSYHTKIEQLIAADERVEWLGEMPQQEFFKALSECDVLCLPSRWPETYSLVLHEASALGVPALVSDLGAPGEIVSTTGAGRALPHDDVQAWAKAISEVAQNPDLLRSWRAALTLPPRVEEEAFFYELIYRHLAHNVKW